MDANPAASLSRLYRRDPVFARCAPDLMRASAAANKDFVREQKQLAKTLKRLEQQRLTRLRQLDEAQRQFAFVMRKKLQPRDIRIPTTEPAGPPPQMGTLTAETRGTGGESGPSKTPCGVESTPLPRRVAEPRSTSV